MLRRQVLLLYTTCGLVAYLGKRAGGDKAGELWIDSEGLTVESRLEAVVFSTAMGYH
jgi:hypothetical protein